MVGIGRDIRKVPLTAILSPVLPHLFPINLQNPPLFIHYLNPPSLILLQRPPPHVDHRTLHHLSRSVYPYFNIVADDREKLGRMKWRESDQSGEEVVCQWMQGRFADCTARGEEKGSDSDGSGECSRWGVL